MTHPLPAEIGPIQGEWDTQSLWGVPSAILFFCLLFDILFVQTIPSIGPAVSLILALSDFSLEDACCKVSTLKVNLC